MDFALSPENIAFRESVRSFAERELVEPAAEPGEDFPTTAWQNAASLGLLGLTAPVPFGEGSDLLTLAVALEEIARVFPSLAFSMGPHLVFATGLIARHGTPSQQHHYLPDLVAGRLVGAGALTEPDAGSDVRAIRTTARRDGSHWILNGTKTFVTNGPLAGVVIVYAVTDESSRAVTAFIVEPGFPGFSVGPRISKLGMERSPTSELILSDCRVSDSQRLGEEGRGLSLALGGFDIGKVVIAAIAVGIAQRCLEASVSYATRRVQFGQSISAFQAIQFKLADMKVRLDAARLLTQRAAWLKDHGLSEPDACAEAKLFASEAAVEAALEAIQIHGGYGYTRDLPLERFLRDSVVLRIGEGTSEIQRVIIARTLLKSKQKIDKFEMSGRLPGRVAFPKE